MLLKNKARIVGFLLKSSNGNVIRVDDNRADYQPPFGLKNSSQLAQSGDRVRDFTKRPNDVGCVEHMWLRYGRDCASS